MTALMWMAHVPPRSDAERQAGREELLRDLKAAREALEHEAKRRARPHSAAAPAADSH